MFSDRKCLRCGHEHEIFVHGHYQCADCGNVTNECCSGETFQNLFVEDPENCAVSWKTCNWCGDLIDPDECFATFKMGEFECDLCKRVIDQE